MGRKPPSLARSLALLAIAAVVPVLLFSGAGALWGYRRQQAELRTQAVSDTRRLSEAIDRELTADMDAASMLAALPQLDRLADLQGFEEVVRREQRGHPLWLTVILLDPQGRRLTNSLEPGRLGSAVDGASIGPVLASGRPLVGNIALGQGRFGIPVRAPVTRDGRVIGIVTIVIRPEGIGELLIASRLPQDWIGTVIDSGGRIVARTRSAPTFLGKPASDSALKARAERMDGTYDGFTLEGIPTVSAFWKSPASGWSVHIGVPRTSLEAPLRRSLAFTIGGFALSLLLSGLFLTLVLRELTLRRHEASATEQSNRLEALGRLTGGVAHDFNNLLMIIQGNTEILQRRLGVTEAERPLAAIREATQRAGRLTRELLVFARGGPAETVVIDLNATLQDFVSSVRQAVGAAVEVKTAFDPRVAAVEVDRVQLELAVLNLAVNARDAMPTGGVLTIATERSSDALVQLSVSDTGTGMAPEIRGRVFEPFFTTKAPGAGTGLGLTQVYGFVRHAGGFIELQSRPGRGTSVILRLPASRSAPSPVAPVPSRPADRALQGLRVLLLDDNPEVREVGAAYLREQGAQVIEGANVSEGAAILERGEADVLVSDIVMPGEADGLDLAESVRRRWPSLSVLLVSGYSTSLAKAGERGFRVLRKPYALDELGAAMGEFAEARQA